MLIATSLPITWQHSMIIASDWVGLTLPGMMELPGSFSGILSSPMPQRGPEASQRISLAIFIKDAARVFSAPWQNTSASLAARASNLLRAVTNGRVGQARHFVGNAHGKLGVGIQSRPHSRSAEGQLIQMRKRRLHMLHPMFQLGDITREFLSQCQWCRIL